MKSVSPRTYVIILQNLLRIRLKYHHHATPLSESRNFAVHSLVPSGARLAATSYSYWFRSERFGFWSPLGRERLSDCSSRDHGKDRNTTSAILRISLIQLLGGSRWFNTRRRCIMSRKSKHSAARAQGQRPSAQGCRRLSISYAFAHNIPRNHIAFRTMGIHSGIEMETVLD